MKPLRETKNYFIRKLICFEICTGKVFGYKPEYRYILTMVWEESKSFGKQVYTDRNPQTFTVTNTVSNLVNEYIKASTFGYGVQIGDKRIVLVRNMCSDLKLDSFLAPFNYAPLNDDEMAEFKCLLQDRDPERHKLSFP